MIIISIPPEDNMAISRYAQLALALQRLEEDEVQNLEIAALSSGGLEMAIAAYHSWGELIYHLFGTDFL